LTIEASSCKQERMTILLTGGRAPVTLELARAFHRFGHRVIVAESVRHHLCRGSRAVESSYRVPAPNMDTESFLKALESIIVNERVDVLIPTCEEIFFVAQGLDRLRKHCKVLVSPIDLLGELHDKWRFTLLAKRHGLTVPETELIRTIEEWLSLASEERMGESLVLKPVFSRFASRVIFLDKGDSLVERRRLLTETLSSVSPKTPWVAQRRVTGAGICTYSVTYDGEVLAHTAYQNRYRVGQGSAIYFQHMEHEASYEWVRKLVKAIHFTGQIAFDFIEEQDGGLYALECNPRATSGIHLFGGDGRFVQTLLRPYEQRGVVLTPSGSQPAMIAAAMLTAGWRGVRSFRELGRWHRDFRSARDVVFDRGDIRPSVEAMLMMLDAWRTSRARGIKMTQATTLDMEWNGEEA